MLGPSFQSPRLKPRLVSLTTLLLAGILAPAAPGPATAEPGAVPHALGRIPPEIAALTLPTGKLIPLSGSPRQLTFEDVERSEFTSSGGIVVSYDVPNPPFPTDLGPAVQTVRSFRVDCASQTIQRLGSMEYGRDGGVVMWLPPDDPEPIKGNGFAEGHFMLVCEGARPPAAEVVGYQSAFDLATRWFASLADEEH